MGITILVFGAVFLLIMSGGLLLFYREEMIHRITEAINPQKKKEEKSLLKTIQQTGLSIGGVVEHFEQVLPKTEAEKSVVQKRLQRAGFRNESTVKVFYGYKVLVPLIFAAIVLVSGMGELNAMMYIAALGIGFLLPDFWLGRRIKVRQKRIRQGLPDILDMLIICIEAGLSMDHATARTSQELIKAQPELCDELGIVVLEQRAGRARDEAWKHLAERTDVDAVRNLVTMLVQAETFGTSIAKTLRVHSDTLRTQRVQAVEEAAAKTTIKLIFPLALFIFPSLFLVVLGPAFIMIIDSFKTLNQ